MKEQRKQLAWGVVLLSIAAGLAMLTGYFAKGASMSDNTNNNTMNERACSGCVTNLAFAETDALLSWNTAKTIK